jgi:hypothetical protein
MKPVYPDTETGYEHNNTKENYRPISLMNIEKFLIKCFQTEFNKTLKRTYP